jgi:hypothetical protein
MTTLTIILFAGCIPLARAITVSRAAGFRGFVGFAIWWLEASARERIILAHGLREFDKGRQARRAQLSEEVR